MSDGFHGPDTTSLDQMIDANGGFYGETPVLDQMLEAKGGYYGPDTSWIQAEMDQLFDPSNPYMTDAVIETNGGFSAAADSANGAWDDYLTN